MTLSDHKLVLGTVQFGLDYGLQNIAGQVSFDEVAAIIDYAATQGISTLDTANMYGESQQVLGKYLARSPHSFSLISKVKAPTLNEARTIFYDCLTALGVEQLYGYLIHRFEEYQAAPEIYDFLLEQKKEGKINKVGFSLYFPHQLEYLFEHQVPVDLVQLPLSIIDQRFKPYLPELKARGVEIHVRSVLLQGIMTKQPSDLPAHFDSIKKSLTDLQSLAKQHAIQMAALALNFAQLQPEVDGAVVGVHRKDQLVELVNSGAYLEKTKGILDQLNHYQCNDEKITVPLFWPQ